MNRKRVVAWLSALALTGCAGSTTTYGPDGRQVHLLNCSGWARSWGMCLEKAGELCGANGYDIIGERSGNTFMASGGSITPLIGREMTIACRAPK